MPLNHADIPDRSGDLDALADLEITGDLARAISLIGRTVDDPAVPALLTERWGQPLPSFRGVDRWMTFDTGLNVLLSRNTRASRYGARGGGEGQVPWVSTLHMERGCAYPIPFGLEYGLGIDLLEELMGPPSRWGSSPRWHVPLLRRRGVVLSYYPGGPIYLQAKWDGETYAWEPPRG
jgi:hypothetical protein